MSRVGNRIINIPEGVTLDNKDNMLLVNGPNGKLEVNICDEVSLKIEDKLMTLTRNSDDNVAKSMHGTTRQLISNAIEGVTEGFSKHLEIIGVGYNVKPQGKRLVFQLGFFSWYYFRFTWWNWSCRSKKFFRNQRCWQAISRTSVCKNKVIKKAWTLQRKRN